MNKEKNQGRKEDWKTESMKGKEVGNKKQKNGPRSKLACGGCIGLDHETWVDKSRIK